MATASTPNDQRQAIPLVPPVDADAEQIDAILKALDRALELHRQREAFVETCKALPFYHQAHQADNLLTFFEEHSPISEYAMRLWASGRGFSISERMHVAPEYKQCFRVLAVVIGADDHGRPLEIATLHARDQWSETREPAPGIVIQLPTAPQSEAVTERAQPRDLDDAAVRFGLLEME